MSIYSFYQCWPTWLENKLQIGANDAHSDDTGRLKVAVADWINDRRHSDVRLSAGVSLSANKKDQCGISHDVTGHLLCPINYNWDDPVYVACYLFLSLQFPSTPHLVYVSISEMLIQVITTHPDSFFVVCTWVRPETLWTQRRDFWKGSSWCVWVFCPHY